MSSSQNVLLTGASGFVASHILNGLVKGGYMVTAAVRSHAKAMDILRLHPEWKQQLSFAYVPDIAIEGAFDDLFKLQPGHFDFILHTASPVNFAVVDIQKELIDPAVLGSVGLLRSAHMFGGAQLKRFVLLGSAVAVLNSLEDMGAPGKAYTEKDWNPITTAQAIQSHDPVLGYNVSKKLAEQAAWEYVHSAKPTFDLCVINPDIIIGPSIHHVPGPRAVNETNMFVVYNFLNGVYKKMEDLTFPFYHFVDVRDVAQAHIIAMTSSSASQHRILLVSGLLSPQLVANIIREKVPELRSRVIEGDPKQILPKGIKPTGWDTSKSNEILGGNRWRYIGLEQSVHDTVRSLQDLEKTWGV